MSLIKNAYGVNLAILAIGDPNSGKGTQSELLLNIYEGRHISMGDAIREKMKEDEVFKARWKPVTDAGEYVDDSVVFGLLTAKAKAIPDDRCGTIIVDGYARNKNQAKLGEVFTYPRMVLCLDFMISLETAVQRAKGRGRTDDEIATVRKRYKFWRENRGAVLKKLSAQGVCVMPIDAEAKIELVAGKVEEVVRGFLKGPHYNDGRKISRASGFSSRARIGRVAAA